MIVVWLMLVAGAAALVVTAARPARHAAAGRDKTLPARSRAFLNWLTNLIGVMLAAVLALALWRRRR